MPLKYVREGARRGRRQGKGGKGKVDTRKDCKHGIQSRNEEKKLEKMCPTIQYTPTSRKGGMRNCARYIYKSKHFSQKQSEFCARRARNGRWHYIQFGLRRQTPGSVGRNREERRAIEQSGCSGPRLPSCLTTVHSFECLRTCDSPWCIYMNINYVNRAIVYDEIIWPDCKYTYVLMALRNHERDVYPCLNQGLKRKSLENIVKIQYREAVLY